MDIFSQISETQLGIGGGVILLFSVVFGVIKGVIRILLGLAGLAAGAVAFWFTFRHGEPVLTRFVEEPEAWMPFGIAGGAAMSAYLAVRHGLGLLCAPIIGSVDALKNKKLLSGILGLGLGSAGLYGGGSASHQLDAMSFLNEQRRGEEVSWLNQILAKTQESWFGNFQQNTDPSMTGYKCDLVKLLSMAKFQNIDVQTEELEAILHNVDIQSLLQDSEIRKALDQGSFQELFHHHELSAFLHDPKNRALLDSLDWRTIL